MVPQLEINVGDNEDDPVFFVSDLLVHLAGEQMEKKASKVIEGEALDLIVGNIPVKDKDKDAVTAGVLNILKESYGIEEQDFLSAELEIVPAGKAREAGFDRSMILAYGQDDRVCAYTSARAVLEVAGEVTDRTACCILVDKEEIGSVGATGMQSRFFENMTAELMELMGEYSELNLRRCLSNSTMLSSDVSAGYDPSYASCFEKKNSAFMGDGMVFNKFTGVRGKSGSNDANAEYMAHIREIMDSSDVVFQTAELGKVDVGGGGTIAYIPREVRHGRPSTPACPVLFDALPPWGSHEQKPDIYEAPSRLRGVPARIKVRGEPRLRPTHAIDERVFGRFFRVVRVRDDHPKEPDADDRVATWGFAVVFPKPSGERPFPPPPRL